MANVFIEFFASVATTYRIGTDIEAASAPNFEKLKVLIKTNFTNANTFEIPDITQEFVCYLSKLKVGKATGLDGIGARLLRAAAPAIAFSLTKVINLSINTGRFPACCWSLSCL